MYYLAAIFILYLALVLLSIQNHKKLAKEKKQADILIDQLEAKLEDITRINRRLQDNYDGVKRINQALVGRELILKKLKEEIKRLRQVK